MLWRAFEGWVQFRLLILVTKIQNWTVIANLKVKIYYKACKRRTLTYCFKTWSEWPTLYIMYCAFKPLVDLWRIRPRKDKLTSIQYEQTGKSFKVIGCICHWSFPLLILIQINILEKFQKNSAVTWFCDKILMKFSPRKFINFSYWQKQMTKNKHHSKKSLCSFNLYLAQSSKFLSILFYSLIGAMFDSIRH